MLKIKKIATRIASTALIACGCLSAQSALAISAIPTTGVCGFAVSGSFPFIGVQLTGLPLTTPNSVAYGSSPSASGSLNWLGTIDFGTSTLSVNIVSQTAQNPNSNGSPNASFTNTQQQVALNFTVSAGPVSGMYTLNLASGAGSINVIPVNGGNTILMQQFVSTSAGGKAGVCQF